MKKFRRGSILILCIGTLWYTGAQAQDVVEVGGTVTSNEDGQPLVGVAVIAGTKNATTTNMDGVYRISVVPGMELTFQYIGYKTLQRIVPIGNNEPRLDVKWEMKPCRWKMSW